MRKWLGRMAKVDVAGSSPVSRSAEIAETGRLADR
jgi:hypothetical protein